MIGLLIRNKEAFLKRQPDGIKIIILYRNLSIIITSLFYFWGNSGHTIQRKLFIVACILCSSILLQYLYMKVYDFTEKIALLLIIEIIGYVILLIPSEGINSPYIWYSLNTILMISIRLSPIHCWINLLIYFCSFFFAAINSGKWNHGFDKSLLDQEMNLVLSLLLITLAMQILGKNIKRIEKDKRNLEEANRLLKESNREIKKSMNYILELYQAVEIFTSQKDKTGLLELIVSYTKKITKASTIIFYNMETSRSILLINRKEQKNEYEETIKDKLIQYKNRIVKSKVPLELHIGNMKFACIPIKSKYTTYGILGIENNSLDNSSYEEQMNFLSNLCAIVLERMELEEINQGLLINEEQNRIANEIHDNVLQRLFSSSCSLYTMIQQDNTVVHEKKSELNLIRNAINYAMKDLRSIIYGMSWEKDGTNDFDMKLKNYIEETKNLTGIHFTLDIQGNYESLSLQQKKAVYRIISEAVGNGVRHSKASEIEVRLDMKMDFITIKVKDNGIGFDCLSIKNKKQGGLGIKNINYLAYYLNGSAQIKSEIGKGTEILITFPGITYGSYKEKIV